MPAVSRESPVSFVERVYRLQPTLSNLWVFLMSAAAGSTEHPLGRSTCEVPRDDFPHAHNSLRLVGVGSSIL